MTTTLHLDGKKAYIRRYGIASSKVLKSSFETLITEADKVIEVIVCRDQAKKYAKRINRLGYLLVRKEDYDMFTYKLTYKTL